MPLGRILVVDDEPTLRQSVRMTLTKAGYDVVEAEDGEKAIQTIRSGDNPLMVDTIICDLQMPKVNGMEAVAFFRQQFPGVPVLVLTGHATVESASALFKKGITDYLTKPIEPAKLVEVVGKAVKKRELFPDDFKV